MRAQGRPSSASFNAWRAFQGRTQALQVAGAQRDRAASRDAVGRVGEPHEALPSRRLEQLNV